MLFLDLMKYLFQDIDTCKVLGQGVTKGSLYVLQDNKLATSLSFSFDVVSDSANNAIYIL